MLAKNTRSACQEYRKLPILVQSPGAAFGDTFTGFTHVRGREVAKALLKLGEWEETKEATPTEQGVGFSVSLKKGAELRLQSWLYDKAGKDLGGAFFAYVEKL